MRGCKPTAATAIFLALAGCSASQAGEDGSGGAHHVSAAGGGRSSGGQSSSGGAPSGNGGSASGGIAGIAGMAGSTAGGGSAGEAGSAGATQSSSGGAAGTSADSSVGIWTSRDELKQIPISGQPGCEASTLCSDAWNAIVSRANGSWGAPNLSDYAGLDHSISVWAGALVAVRLSFEPDQAALAQTMRKKTLQAFDASMGTEAAALPTSNGGKDDGSLAIARQLLRYVVAADLLGVGKGAWGAGYKGAADFVDYMMKTAFTFRVGDGGQRICDSLSSSNGSNMGRASCVAMARYLGDNTEIDRMWDAFRRFTGDLSAPDIIEFSGTGQNWYHDNAHKLGINPTAATCAGSSYPADGVIPNDQGRGGGCPSDPNSAPGYTAYPWEGLQGAFAQAVMLDRLGKKDARGNDPWQVSDQALLRAVKYQWYLQTKFGGVWYDASRAAWVKHLAKVIYGYQPRSYDASDGGRNMTYTQWTHR